MGSSTESHPWSWLSSTVNVANFVTVKPSLEGDERSRTFQKWKKQMLCFLESQDLVGFVEGNMPLGDDEQKLWRRTDMLIQGWILGSIGEDALNAVWEKGTARDVWVELENIFNQQQQNFSGVEYPLPSTVNVANFVTVKPCLEPEVEGDETSDFKIWKEQMLCLLESQDVVGFVNGEVGPPENTTTDRAWRRTDRLVKGWILGSIGKDALQAVWEEHTARDVWLELHNIFNHRPQQKQRPWPTNVNVANFVTVKPCLKGDERARKFRMWQQQMVLLLLSEDVFGFVNGAVLPPQNTDDEQSKMAWRRTDGLVRGWIIGSIGEDALYAVMKKETAKDVWVELKNIFDDHPPQPSGDSSKYLAVYQAALRGDWETATNFFPNLNDLATTVISSYSDTALHIAVMSGTVKANDFVEKLVQLMPPEADALTDIYGDTILHNAATIGNTEAVRVLLNKYPTWLGGVCNKSNMLPVIRAALSCKKDTIKLLISKHEEEPEPNIFAGQQGLLLLNHIISCEFLDIALELAKNHPNLAKLTEGNRYSALDMLVRMDTVFPRFETFSWWQRFVYNCIPSKKSTNKASLVAAADIENVNKDGAVQEYLHYIILTVVQKMKFMIWTAIEHIVPEVKMLRKKKAKRQQALELAKFLCDQLVSSPDTQPSTIFRDAIMAAAQYGNTEIVEMIIDKYPEIIYHSNRNYMSVFHVAAIYRFENIFNLIYSMSDRKYLFSNWIDNTGNNLMHICGKLAPTNRLNLVAGAALQMQRELQWFKEMEKHVDPSKRTWTNYDKQTPQMIFTNEHNNLKAEGEKWMKDTANACTIAAALIATVMFAAAFTVPGGLQSDTGFPLFLNEPAFNLFAVSDAISLFASIFALLMFLSILTSRYAEEDFLYVLPKRLSIGLLSLFISITFMMVAFCATFYLVFRRNDSWYQLFLGAFACFPVTSFVLLQFPLLVDVVWSTYDPGIFGKKTKRFIY